jgi:hypothetical protein
MALRSLNLGRLRDGSMLFGQGSVEPHAGVDSLRRMVARAHKNARRWEEAVLPINLETRADVVIIPPEPGHDAVTARRDVSAASAIRYVVEQLSSDKRSRAVVRTARALLFIEEIEALYGLPEFPRQPSPGPH